MYGHFNPEIEMFDEESGECAPFDIHDERPGGGDNSRLTCEVLFCQNETVLCC